MARDILQGKRVVIMAGGTGGHIFPALAVADELAANGAQVTWLGSDYGIERKLLGERYPIDLLKAQGVRGKSIKAKLLFPFKLARAVWQARKVLKSRQADVVIGFGGYASGPGGLAAAQLGIPLIVHEQNARAGLTNRKLAGFAKAILLAFPVSGFEKYPYVRVVGNPVRKEIVEVGKSPRDFFVPQLNLLVIGGSQGAQVLNEVVPAAMKLLPESAHLHVWHQSGEKLYEQTTKAYASIDDVTIRVDRFIDNMAEAYQWAHLIVCRAGALTVSEVAAAGLPSIMVPFPHAVDDHQYHNAQFLVTAGAGRCIRQEDFNPAKFAAHLRVLDLNRFELMQQSERAIGVAQIYAVDKVVDVVCEDIQ